ncbi:MAG: sugar-binding protein, partial [Akkermansia sp.]
MKNPVFNTDINQFTNRLASGSGGNPGGPEPFNENPPAAPRDESWGWTLNVRPLGPNEEAVCHMMIGADDLAKLSIDNKVQLNLGPRGPQGGGRYSEVSASMPIGEGSHKVSLTYSNIPYDPQSENAAALSYSIKVEVMDKTTSSSSSYIPDDGDPDSVDDDDDGEDEPCECSSSSSSSDSQSSSSCPCPQDDDNGDGDNGEPSSSCGCDKNNGGSSSGATGARMNTQGSMLSAKDSKYSTAGKQMITQVRKADMIWRTNFGSFRGMTGMPYGFLEIISRNFSSALWLPSSLAFMHPMASEVTSLPPSGLSKNTAFQISRGATNVNYFTYGDGETIAPIAGSAKRGGSASFSASVAARLGGDVSSSKMSVNVRSNQGNTVTYEADSPSSFGKASSYSTKSGVVYTRPQFDGVLDLIRAADGSIRQIWNLWDGLVNIENITANGYRIAFYLPEQVGQKQSGLYPVTG